MNPLPSQIQSRQLFPSHLNHVSLTKLSVKGVSTLQCREYFFEGDWWPVVTPSPVNLGLFGPFQICGNSWDGGAWKVRLFYLSSKWKRIVFTSARRASPDWNLQKWHKQCLYIMEIIDTFNDLLLTRFQCFFWPKFLRKTVFKTQRVSVTWPKLLQLAKRSGSLTAMFFHHGYINYWWFWFHFCPIFKGVKMILLMSH